jgi:hypothetical protein
MGRILTRNLISFLLSQVGHVFIVYAVVSETERRLFNILDLLILSTVSLLQRNTQSTDDTDLTKFDDVLQWFEQSNTCPVCKAGASKDKLVPIYGRNSEGNITEDPRDSIPERPAAQRPEPMPQYNPFQGMFQHNFAGGGVSFSAGFFPLGFQMVRNRLILSADCFPRSPAIPPLTLYCSLSSLGHLHPTFP